MRSHVTFLLQASHRRRTGDLQLHRGGCRSPPLHNNRPTSGVQTLYPFILVAVSSTCASTKRSRSGSDSRLKLTTEAPTRFQPVHAKLKMGKITLTPRSSVSLYHSHSADVPHSFTYYRLYLILANDNVLKTCEKPHSSWIQAYSIAATLLVRNE
jgi:hypothetical protein